MGRGRHTIPEELLRIAAPTLAEGVDLVAEVGNRGSVVRCEGAGGAASFCGTGRGRHTIPGEAGEEKGFLAGTAECAECSACREDSMRSSPAGTDASLMQAIAEVSFADATLTKEADGRGEPSRQHQLPTPEPPTCLLPAAAETGAATPVREARPTTATALAKCFFVFGEEQPLVRLDLQSQAGWFKGDSEMQPLGAADLLPHTKELVGNGGRQSAALTYLQSQLKRHRSSGKTFCEALPCDLMEPIFGEEGLRTGAVHIIGGMVQDKKPEHAGHSVVKFKCEALPCDLKAPFSQDEGPHTESARRFGGTVKGEGPEGLVCSTGQSYCEALPCDLMEPILEKEGLCTYAEICIGGTVQCKEPGCTVLAKFDGVALPWNSMEPISRAGGLHDGGARCISGALQSAVPEVALSTLIFEHLEEPVAILSRKVSLGGSSTFEAAQVIAISWLLVGAMLIYSREGGLQGSTFEAALISPSSEYLKEQLLDFSRGVGLVGSFTRPGRAVGGLWAVVQAAAVVASAAVVAAEVWGSVGERWLQQQWALGPLLALFVGR
jgi:hypothetical protein